MTYYAILQIHYKPDDTIQLPTPAKESVNCNKNNKSTGQKKRLTKVRPQFRRVRTTDDKGWGEKSNLTVLNQIQF